MTKTSHEDTILLSIESGLATVTFNRPERLNALDFETGLRWREVAQSVASDDSVRAVLLAANGPAFHAGGDVMSMATSAGGGADVTASARVIHEGIQAMVTMPKPVVAAVHGAVAGGGLGLLLTADYIVAGEHAKFVSKYANIGLTPDLGVSTLLPRAVGERRALQLLLQDRTLSAQEAHDWGLVAEVVAAQTEESPVGLRGRVIARAQEVAQFWLSNAAGAFGQAKRLVRVGAHRSFAENLDDEAATIGQAFDTPEAQLRIKAFASGGAAKG